MATFTWYNGNQGIFRYNNFDSFDIVSNTGTEIVMEYNGNRGPYAYDQTPYTIVLDITGYRSIPNDDGGDTITLGSVTGISYYDIDGKLLIDGTGLNVSLPVLQNLYDVGGFNVFQFLVAGGNTFVGSDDGSGPVSDWDGEDIKTGWGDDIVNANGGDDYIQDNGGTDTYNGGDGQDEVDYGESFWNYSSMVMHGITADLGAGTVLGWDGKTDTLISIEGVRGTFLNDTMIGDANDNRFMGYQGRDTIDGGQGFDIVSYRNDANQGGYNGITASLRKQAVIDGFGQRDTVLVNVEGVEGTNYDDAFIDSARDNFFRGRDGDDTFVLSTGNDQVRGDGGSDFFVFRTDIFGDDTIRDFEDGIDTIRVKSASFDELVISQDGTDALIEWEGNSIRLWDFDANNLTQDDFV